MSKSIGFAVVGTGMIAEVHAQAIKDTPEARLVAVWTRAAEKRTAAARRRVWRRWWLIPKSAR